MTESKQTQTRGKQSLDSGAGKNIKIEVASIILVAFSIFALCAMMTYSPADASVFHSISGAAGEVHNACGRVGADLAAVLIQCFGLAAFLSPAAVFFIAVAVWKREGSARLLRALGGLTVAVIALAVFLTLQWKFWPYGGTLILTGGAFGTWIADSLVHQFNALGASLMSLLVFFLAVALSTPVSVAHAGAVVFGMAGGWIRKGVKLVTSFALFYVGLVAMKAASWLGARLHGSLDGALAQARGLAPKEAAPRKKKAPLIAGAEALDDEEEDEEPATLSAKDGMKDGKKPKVADPVIGNDPVIETREAAKDTKRKKDKAEPAGITASAASEPEPTIGADAPNALPELEKRARGATAAGPARPAPTKKTSEPAILPHEDGPRPGEALSPLAAAMANDDDAEDEMSSAIVTSDLANAVAGKAAKRLEKAAKAAAKRGQWKLPTVEFLKKVPKIETNVNKERLLANAQMLQQKFADFDIEGEVTAVRPGPVITLYEFKPGPGIKVSRIASMADDLAMALSASSVRILAPLPGKSVVGIEIPSEVREMVYLREFLQHPDFNGKHLIPVVMGKDIAGSPYLSDLAKMPHLLCAGQTGSGKSVFMNGLIISLLYRFTPDELRLIMIDPKTVEFRPYHDIPHLLLPVVEDPGPAATALKWAVREMDRRYRIMAKTNTRNLASFNQKIDELGDETVRDLLYSEEKDEDGEPIPSTATTGGDWHEAFEPDETGLPRVGKLPYIVIIIDELADLMMVAKKEVEISIARIAQKARAAGIHLVIATQRPSTDVITGLIKANLPSRCSFQLSSNVDSRTILDRPGAERLLGHGDMLFIPPGVSNALRLHGAYVDDDEINKITGYLKSQGKPAYRDEILIAEEDAEGGGGDDEDNGDDELFREAIELVKQSGHASASYLQRHLKVGYNRAARMIETMESRGIVGPADGSRPREVLLR